MYLGEVMFFSFPTGRHIRWAKNHLNPVAIGPETLFCGTRTRDKERWIRIPKIEGSIPTEVKWIFRFLYYDLESLQTFKLRLHFKITEIGDMGSLEESIKMFGCSMENAMTYISQIGQAMLFLHNRRFIHRNIRASSVYIYTSGNVSLCRPK